MKINKINGTTVANFVNWLRDNDCGCCHFNVFNTEKYLIHIVIGWHNTDDGYEIAWKIGMETRNNITQCDFDIDFIMPFDENGEVYDTVSLICNDENWDNLAKEMNKVAKEVVKFQLEMEG